MGKGTGSLDSDFEKMLQRALDGEELTIEDGERLLTSEGAEIEALVRAADEVRRRRVGDVVTYIVNRNLNFTNICVGSCKFCAFHRSPGDRGAYTLTPEQVSEKVREAVEFGATEICMQGGLHPDFRLSDYLNILKAVRGVSRSIHIHAFSPAELNHMADREGLSLEEGIRQLRDAGLNSVPGTAAEMLVDRVRSIICPDKLSRGKWVETIKICHKIGLPTTATMLYGTVETSRERAEHLGTIRDIQRETRGFTEFVPLAFMSKNTELQRMGVISDRSEVDDLRVHATARLMLAGYVDNIQASWVKLGTSSAQSMLRAGANDISGTLMEESITRAAGGKMSKMIPKGLESLIRGVGRIPRRRETTYKLL